MGVRMIAESELIKIFREIELPEECRSTLFMALRNFTQANEIKELLKVGEEELKSLQQQDGAPQAISLHHETMEILKRKYEFHWQYFREHLKRFISCMRREEKHLS